MKVGDILRYTRFQGKDLRTPAWFQVYEGSDRKFRAMSIYGGVGHMAPGESYGINVDAAFDLVQREIVPLDELPDEILVVLAKRALL